MAIRRLSTGDVPAPARFDAWADMLSATHMPWELVGRGARGFDASVTVRSAGGVDVVACTCDPCEGVRSAALVERGGADRVGILFELAGSERVRQGDREAELAPGDFVLWDGARPMEFRVLEPLTKLSLFLPKTAMRRVLPDLDGVLGTRISGRDGLGPIVGAHLRQLSADLDRLSEHQLAQVIETTLELVAAGVATAGPEPAASAGADLFDRLRRYVADNLADPALDPARIARANGISLRYLHKIFSAHGLSVSRYVRAQRLERCRRELLRDRGRPVLEIAFDWGFNDPSHFSRCFRAAFGVAPSRMRRGPASS